MVADDVGGDKDRAVGFELVLGKRSRHQKGVWQRLPPHAHSAKRACIWQDRERELLAIVYV